MQPDREALRARFEQVVRRYGDDVLRAAMMLTRNRADAEDIVQETFLKYATAAPQFASEAHEKAWLLRVAINLGKDCVKSAWHRKTDALDETIPGADCFAADDAQALYSHVLRLPPKYRTAIHLFYYEGYSVREISKLVGQNEPAVKKQLSRGRELLRQALKGAGDYAF